MSGLGDQLRKKLRPKAQSVSVWRPGRQEYDYYLVPKGVQLRLGPVPKGKPAFGEALTTLLPTLPKASIKAGKGNRARGRIVADRGKGGMSLGALIAIGLDRAEGETGQALGLGDAPKKKGVSAGTVLLIIGGVYLLGHFHGWWKS